MIISVNEENQKIYLQIFYYLLNDKKFSGKKITKRKRERKEKDNIGYSVCPNTPTTEAHHTTCAC